MTIRTLNQPLMFATMDALGGSAISLGMDEVYTGLQMGVVDGWENNRTTIAAYQMWDTGATYFAWTNHLMLPDLLIAGRPFYDGLDEQQREWVTEATRATVQQQSIDWEASEERAEEQMREAGMTITDVDIEAFRSRVQPLYEQYFERYGPEFERLVNIIREIK